MLIKIMEKFNIYLFLIICVINFGKIESHLHCSRESLKDISIQPICEYNRERIPCDMPLLVGTRVTIHCQIGYTLPNKRVKVVIICTEDGKWDFEPFQCEPICGTETILEYAVIQSPWQAIIYKNSDNENYKEVCSGTIISRRIVLSSAHCFINNKTGFIDAKSLFQVEVGKYRRDINTNEHLPSQLLSIMELYIPSKYSFPDPHHNIAILAFNNFILFGMFVQPACVEWQSFENQSPKPNTIGKISGWGRVKGKNILRVADLKVISYDDCLENKNQLSEYLYGNDTFCVKSRNGQSLCDANRDGSGIVILNIFGKIKKYYLWGISNFGFINPNIHCSNDDFIITMTNIQFYSSKIQEYVAKYN